MTDRNERPDASSGRQNRVRMHQVLAILLAAVSPTALAAQATQADTSSVPDAPQSPAAAAAQAVETQAEAGAAPADGSDIVVTGSRIANGFSAPTPVTVASAQELRQAAPRNLADGLIQLPAFSGSLRDQTVVTAATGGTNGQSLLNLRNLGANRTLVLLDGRRLPASNTLGSVDANVLPQQLVRRVDVVTGGASAAYGSDAVAGVVNFLLDTKFEGIKGELQSGVSSRGDLPLWSGSLAFGTSFADNRGRIVASGEIFDQKGVGANRAAGREWYDVPAGQIPNPVVGARPSILVIPNIRSSLGSYGGLISSGPLRGTQFLPGGVPAPFNYGSITGTSFQSGGDGAVPNIGLAPNQRRGNVFAHAEYDVADRLTLFAEGSYSRNHSVSANSINPNTGAGGQFTIFRDNAYLPASILQRMIAANVQSFPLGRYERDFPVVEIETKTILKRGAAGFQGSLSDRWKIDGSYSYGVTKQRVAQNNLPILRNLYASVDAVVNPANGQIVCRSTLAGLDAGCVPINLFGEGSPSQSAIDYIIGDSYKDLTLKQQVAGLNISGDLGEDLNFGAGAISLAFGVEYRRESASQTVDALSPMVTTITGLRGAPTSLQNRPGAFQFFNPLPLSGRYNIKEGYAEIGVPVLRDLPLVRSLDVNGAVRYADYSQSGGVTTWKAGFNYAINDDIRLRLTRSRDIRGPNILELFNSATQNSSNQVYKGVTTPSLIITSGNAALRPEKANTLTYGGVLRPSFLPGFQASVDYYKIAVKGAIGTLGSQRIIDDCATGSSFACSLFSVTSANTLIINIQSLNLNIQKAAGYDFEVAYSRPLAGGQMSLRLFGNRSTVSYTQGPGSPVLPLLDTPVNPKWRASLQANFTADAFSLFAQGRYIHKAKFDPTRVEGIDTNDNTTPTVIYLDLGGTIRVPAFGQNQELFLSVNNVLDRDPPVATLNPTSYSLPTSPAYDQIGRFFTVGLRFRL